MRRTMIAVAIGLALSQAADAQKTQVYFGEDPGPGNNTRLKHYPKAQEAYDKFKSTLHELDSFSFESLESNPDYPLKLVTGRAAHLEQKWWEYELDGKDIKLDFGDNETAVLKNMSALNRLPDQNINAYGGFPTSGNMYVSLIGKGPEATVESTIEFSEPQSAFGFYVTDIEKNKLQIELIRDGQKDEVVEFPLAATPQKPSPNGGICFVGVINKERPFKKLKLTNPGVGGEGFGFDDMMIAKPQHIKKIHLPPRFIVETYGVNGRGQRTEADPYFIGVADSRGKILQASPVEAWQNRKGVRTITREELPGGFVALKTDAGYLPDLSQTITAENTFEEMSPMYHEPGDTGFITLKVANSSPARYLRHSGYKLLNAMMHSGEVEKVFLQDVTWHFHEAPSETFSLADANRILTGKWKANLEKTEDRFGRKPGLHDLLVAGFDVTFSQTSFSAKMGANTSSFSDSKLEGPKGDSHFILHATNSDGDKHDEDIQIVDEDHIVFLFQDGTAPIVFDRMQNESL